jgi:hypothetical protein
MDLDDWDRPELPDPAEPPDFWSLMGFVPEATRAAYLGTTVLLVWDFELR